VDEPVPALGEALIGRICMTAEGIASRLRLIPRVVPVLDLHPARALTLYVPAALPPGNNSLQITLAGEAEQVFAAPLDVIETEQA